MKRNIIVRILRENGWFSTRNSDHEIFHKPGVPRPIPVSWQREIKETIAKKIFSEAGIKFPPRG